MTLKPSSGTRLLYPSFDPVDTLHYERSLYTSGLSCVAGLDEAGRGPLAGPVVAACVILPRDTDCHSFKDSKVLSSRQRDRLYALLQDMGAVIGIGSASSREIEWMNILQASLLAMKRSLEDCTVRNNGLVPDFLLVDGTSQVPTAVQQRPLVKGESRSASIAAASIVAKVIRDRVMAAWHQHYPGYNFLQNQGYPTREHRLAIHRHGLCPLHRKTFKGVREYVGSEFGNTLLHQATICEL